MRHPNTVGGAQIDQETKAMIIRYLIDNQGFEAYRTVDPNDELSDTEVAGMLIGQTDSECTYGEPCNLEDANMLVSTYRWDDLTDILDIIFEPVPDSYVNMTSYFV